MDPSIPRAIDTQGSLLRVRGMDGEPFTTLVVRSMKENGRTIKSTGRCVSLSAGKSLEKSTVCFLTDLLKVQNESTLIVKFRKMSPLSGKIHTE